MARNSYPKISRVRWHDGRSSDDAPAPGGPVVALDTLTRLDIDPGRVLASAIGRVTEVAVIGWDTDGELYVASSVADGADLLWMLEKTKIELFRIAGKIESGEAI